MNVAGSDRPRVIDVCADDFGLTQAASLSILHLGERGALSSTSCAIDGTALAAHLPALRALRPRLRVGLHFNLTGNPTFAGSQPVTRWIRDCWLGRVDRRAMATEVARQLDRFGQLFDSPPDFVAARTTTRSRHRTLRQQRSDTLHLAAALAGQEGRYYRAAGRAGIAQRRTAGRTAYQFRFRRGV